MFAEVALTTCPGCGREARTIGGRCPHCGRRKSGSPPPPQRVNGGSFADDWIVSEVGLLLAVAAIARGVAAAAGDYEG